MNNINKMNINQSASEDFLNYALSVIKERAISDIEDNLKPVHKRILYSMNNMKLFSNKKTVKSATVVGETMKAHPHGDASIYDALVRLSQPWKMRYPLVFLQGNGGSITGSPAAAQRYTEVKLTPIGELMLKDIKNGVDFIDTYDGENKEPRLLPSVFPNILCNGNMGIAVGMSSSIMPHNLREVANLITAYISNNNLTVEEMLSFMPGPDLPTGGTIINIEKIKEIYETGKGTLKIQSKYHIEEKNKKSHIVFTEIPYMVSVDSIISDIKKLFEEGLLDDVHDIENNTGRNGIEIRVILKANVQASKILNILFAKTRLENSIRFGTTILRSGSPVETNLKGLIAGYLNHRHNVIINIYTSKKQKLSKRLHIVEGLLVAVSHIDEIIEIVKNSATKDQSRQKLIQKYELTTEQADAILDMRISQLNKLDTNKLDEERLVLIKDLEFFEVVLNEKKEREVIIISELQNMARDFGDSRRTILKSSIAGKNLNNVPDLTYVLSLYEDNNYDIDLIDDLPFSAKGRVGKKLYSKTPKQVVIFSNKDNILLLDKKGKSIRLSGLEFEKGKNQSFYSNKKIKNSVEFILKQTEEDLTKEYFIIATKGGYIKKTLVSDYNFNSLNYAIRLKKDDAILSASFVSNKDFVIVLGEENKINKYSVSEITSTGRNTTGVKITGLKTLISATFGEDSNNYIIYDSEGNAKKIIGKDIQLGSRMSKGIQVNEGNINIFRSKRSQVLLISSSLKGYVLDVNEIDYKNIKNVNNRIYNGELKYIGH